MTQAADGQWRDLAAGCVLAGGLSRRMGGGDKSLRDLGGTPMMGHVIARLAPQVGKIAINANGDPARFGQFGLPVVEDTVQGNVGPLGGILTAIRWTLESMPGARWVVTVATDTPFFPADLVNKLVTATDDDPLKISLARSGDRVHPVFGLWPVALADNLEDALRVDDLRKVLVWVRRHANTEVVFEKRTTGAVEIDPFFNVNTPDDMEAAGAILEELGA